MRAPPIPPSKLDPSTRPLHDEMRAAVERDFKCFIAIREDGALLGPWAPWLRYAKFGRPAWEMTKAVSLGASLPPAAREVAILVTGAHFRSGYELYAHVSVAESRGLADTKLATIVAGQRPADLTGEEAVAYDVASALVAGGTLPELTWRAAVTAFGEQGAAELVFLIGTYCLVSMTLNAFDVSVSTEAG
jgi:4-carboxymuconolactone decarboxylase